MGIQADELFVSQYARNLEHDSQQRGSIAWQYGMEPEEPVQGDAISFDRLGEAPASQKPQARFADSPNMLIPERRRWAMMTPDEWGTLIESDETARKLVDPRSKYAEAGSFSMGRKMDDVFFGSALGNALEGKSLKEASNVPLPATQIISVGTTGLTLDKLQSARQKREDANVPEQYKWHLFWSPFQKTELLNETKATSGDFVAAANALVMGKIEEFLGFNFHISTRLPKVGTTRKCIAVAERAIGRGRAMKKVEIGPDPAKKFNTRVFYEWIYGAVRVEDVQVIEIDCKET